MRKYLYIIFLILTSIGFASCFEDDEQVTPLPIEEIKIPYSMYEYQTYYSLSNQAIGSYHHFADWDLGFESSKDGYHIILNYARFMYAGNTYSTDFYSIQANIANKMLYDNSSGNLDSTVLVDWIDISNPNDTVYSNNVYIIDRGKDEEGKDFGLKKITFEKLERDTFYIHFANLDNSEEYYYRVAKDTTKNFVLFSFEDGGKVSAQEPDKEVWDICFTKYSTIIPDDFGIPTDYLVRGVYLNPYKNIEVALDTINHFYRITPEMISDYKYTTNQDAIGYEWKIFENNNYRVLDKHSYILKNVNGSNYKLRFTNFFNDEGVRGYPSFELIEF